jgi:hypothetical protein
MKMTRSTWTGERLDHLDARVTDVRDEVRGLRIEMRDLRTEMGTLQRTIIQVGCGLIGTLAVGILGLVGTQL